MNQVPGYVPWAPMDDEYLGRLEHMSLEILWMMAAGFSSRQISAKFQQHGHQIASGYVGKVKSRYKRRGQDYVLEAWSRILSKWPEP